MTFCALRHSAESEENGETAPVTGMRGVFYLDSSASAALQHIVFSTELGGELPFAACLINVRFAEGSRRCRVSTMGLSEALGSVSLSENGRGLACERNDEAKREFAAQFLRLKINW